MPRLKIDLTKLLDAMGELEAGTIAAEMGISETGFRLLLDRIQRGVATNDSTARRLAAALGRLRGERVKLGELVKDDGQQVA